MWGVKMKEKIIHPINFDRPPCIYWSDRTKANYLQRQILIHSIIYYELDENIISDKEYDNLSLQLLDLKYEMRISDYCQTEYYNQFKYFDGSTGFDLYHRLSGKQKKYLRQIARYVLNIYKGGGN
jgi:hypothetical protein